LCGEKEGEKSRRWYSSHHLKLIEKGDGATTFRSTTPTSSDIEEESFSKIDDVVDDVQESREFQGVGRPVSVVSTWFGVGWSRNRHGNQGGDIWYTGKTVSWDPKKKWYTFGGLEGDDTGTEYKLTIQLEIKAHTTWEQLGQPEIGGVTSSSFPLETPHNPIQQSRSNPIRSTGDLWVELIKDPTTGIGLTRELRAFPYDDLSYNIDTYLLVELSSYVAYPERLLHIDMYKAIRTNELCCTLLTLTPSEGILSIPYKYQIVFFSSSSLYL
jgi:hypothetical protein